VPRLNAALQRVVPVVPGPYAHDLYAHLRALDAQNVDVILVEAPPRTPGWGAINDRLARAARHAAEGETT
jgi:L-threonylcarbamoyladenylate synthase